MVWNVERKPLIKTENLHKWFENVHAVDGVDMEICPGEIVGLIGDNGAGKSTLIKMLAGVYKPTSGKIYFEGKEVKISSVKHARKLGIETVYQERAIVDSSSVAKNIFLGREPIKFWRPLHIVDMNKMREESEKAVKRLGLNISSMDLEARFCSGGELQGIAIVRSMLSRAKLVILDEPTTALAVKGVREVNKYIKQLKKEKIACIIISHSIQSVIAIADRVIIISKGKKILDTNKKNLTVKEVENILLKA